MKSEKNNKGMKMKKPNVMVVNHGKKFAVLVNFIQAGTEYSDKSVADHQASMLVEQYANGERIQ
jgi:hypothetical protein